MKKNEKLLVIYISIFRVDYDEEEGVYDLSVSMVEFGRDNGRFECRIKEDGTGVELYTKVLVHWPGPLTKEIVAQIFMFSASNEAKLMHVPSLANLSA